MLSCLNSVAKHSVSPIQATYTQIHIYTPSVCIRSEVSLLKSWGAAPPKILWETLLEVLAYAHLIQCWSVEENWLSSLSSYHLQIASCLGIGLSFHFLISVREFCLAWAGLVHIVSLCEFIWESALCVWKMLFPESCPPPLTLTFFLRPSPPSHRSLSLEWGDV